SGHRRKSQTTNSNFFGDSRDAMLIRGPGGLLVNSFDGATGQWMQVPDAPALSDANNWDQPEYYSTIQSADIDGDGIAELLARGADGIEVWQYDPTAQQWDPLPTCTRFSDAQDWNASPAYYSTIQFADIDNDNVAEAVGRGGTALYV